MQSEMARRGSRPLLFLLGLATAALGVAIMVWPDRTIRTAALLIGIALILAGAGRIVGALVATGEESGSRMAMLVVGGLTLILGIFFVRNLTRSLEVIVVLTGLLYVLGGLVELFLAAAFAEADRGLALVLGIATLGVGIVLVAWPNPSLTFFAVVAGIYLVVAGLGEMLRAFRRSSEPTVGRATVSMTGGPSNAT